MRHRGLGTLIVAIASIAWATEALALPDIVPEIFDARIEVANVGAGDVAEGCAGGTTNRTLVRYSLRTRNMGPDDLVLGDPGCPNCTTHPGAACTNPLFVCSIAHGHVHFNSFAQAVLLNADNQVVAQGRKTGFCVEDLECPHFTYTCSYQGITAGCADLYVAGLPCQYIDVTGIVLPDGIYKLRVTADPEGIIPEADESNNVTHVSLQVGVPVCENPNTYVSADIPQPIPDLGVAISTLTIPTGGNITDVNIVGLTGTHTYDGDMQFHLISPANTDITVIDHRCGSSHDFNLGLDDTAATSIPCPPTDGMSHIPSGGLATFIGEDTAGTWTMKVFDTATQDSGTLTGWGLRVCTAAPPLCGETPRLSCRAAQQSRFVLKDRIDDRRDRLRWEWLMGKATSTSDFGDPINATNYALCVYDQSAGTPQLVMRANAPAGGTCVGSPCWTATADGFTYVDPRRTPDGLRRVSLQAGAAGQSNIVAVGNGKRVQMPTLPLTQDTNVIVQLVNSDGQCWEAAYPQPAVTNTSSKFDDSF